MNTDAILTKDDPSDYLFTQASASELSAMLYVNPFLATMELKRGKRPLHLASRAKRADLVRLLLQWGAIPDAPDLDGRTALDEARLVGSTEVATLLQQAVYKRRSNPFTSKGFTSEKMAC